MTTRHIILIKGVSVSTVDEARIYPVEPGKELSQAHYWFDRRIEKEDWTADQVFIAEEIPKETLEGWLELERKRQDRRFREEREQQERAELERLKAKYER